MTSKTTNRFSPEVRARTVRMVTEHEAEHPAIKPIGAAFGRLISNPQPEPLRSTDDRFCRYGSFRVVFDGNTSALDEIEEERRARLY